MTWAIAFVEGVTLSCTFTVHSFREHLPARDLTEMIPKPCGLTLPDVRLRIHPEKTDKYHYCSGN
jgi:hypothetical protein